MIQPSHVFIHSQAGRVLLAEDDPATSLMLKKGLEKHEIICDCSFGFAEAEDALNREVHQALVADVYLESAIPSGLSLITIATRLGISSVLITGSLDVGIAKEGLNRGADQLLEKPVNIRELVRVLLNSWDNPKGLIGRRERLFEIHQLTRKEKQITRLILKGLTNQEIAGVIETTLSTIKFYNNQIFQKFCVKNRPELFTMFFPT